MKVHAFKLKKGYDLKKCLEAFSDNNNIKASVVLSCVGSLKKANIRLADQSKDAITTQPMYILGLNGTLGNGKCHFHIRLSNKDGNVIGGHLNDGCIINDSCEIVILEFYELDFDREFDDETGQDEFIIRTLFKQGAKQEDN